MVKKRKKLKARFLIFFIIFLVSIVAVFTLGFDTIVNQKIKNIYITGNENISDKTIIELAGLENYPKIFSVSNNKIKKNLKTNPYIKEVNIKKELGYKIYINIKENKVLFYDDINSKIVLENNKHITEENNFTNIPILSSEIVDKNIYIKFVKKFVLVDKNIIDKISEIIYSPTSVDKERFIFYMDDKNEVYITLTKIERINGYLEFLDVFDNKKGRIYLDAGKYFEEY